MTKAPTPNALTNPYRLDVDDSVDPERTAAYLAAGLWDPDDAGPRGAPQRLELLDALVDRGASVQRMAATPIGDLISLGFDLVVEQGSMSAVDLATRVGIGVDELLELYRTVGIEIDDPDAMVFEDSEIELVQLLRKVLTTFPGQTAQEVLRSIDDALSNMAAAAISAFVGTVEIELADADDELAWAQAVVSAGELGLDIAGNLRPLYRHQLRAGIAHQRVAMRRVGQRQLSELSVGFVDLVGYTSRTAEMDVQQLIDFTSDFRSRAYDVVGSRGGRVVKHIGDEIMFSALDADRACEIGLALLESFGEERSRPRGGVAHGPMLARYGDLYGPLVNLASRLTEAAAPGELLAPSDIEQHMGSGAHVRLVQAGRRQLKGFAEPVQLVSVESLDRTSSGPS